MSLDLTPEQREWLAGLDESLTSELNVASPSAWAESRRYLPPSVTPMPGFYRFDVAPYLREIVDCLSVDSPVREVSVMKGVQLGLTVGVIENGIGYFIEHVKTAPMMMVTADAELAKLRMESHITPMLQHSDLEHLIKSADETNSRKTGKTDRKIEWVGGGYLVPFGAQNANKLRSIPIQILLRDEIDGWPDVVGKDGDPLKLSADRTAAYEVSRKILDISTPLIKGQSKIAQRYAQGDQRQYFVCCVSCGWAQTLRWRRVNPQTGETTGIVWETEGGRLVIDSVRYLCERCRHEHVNDDKTRLLDPEHGAEWRPTAEPITPNHRSYHINALYSPVGMQTWSACVLKWLEAWDDEANRARDFVSLQVFYNNVLGEPFELRGEKLRFENVSEHRRSVYRYGEIPNRYAEQWCGSKTMLLTCAVDVHKEALKVAVIGWCRERRSVLVDYWTLEGTTEELDNPRTWGRLRELIEQDQYVADDGAKYRIAVTLIDSGYLTDHVYQFCSEYAAGVFPVKGQAYPPRSARVPEFSPFTTANGLIAYGVTVDLYKDRLSALLRRAWNGDDIQPYGHFNAPRDITDKQLRELTVEVKREKIEKSTGKRVGYEWHRPAGAANELWDLLIYGSAALDMIAWDWSRSSDMEYTNWPAFWEACENERLFFE